MGMAGAYRGELQGGGQLQCGPLHHQGKATKMGWGGHSAKLQIPLTEPVSCGVQQLLRHEIIDDRF